MPKRVKALRDGFYDGARRRKGSVFTVSDGKKLGKWMEEIKPAAAPVAAPAAKAPPPAAKPVKKVDEEVI